MTETQNAILQMLASGFRRLHVLVVGDVMLDRYIFGEVERISPEAPVPVLRQTRQYSRPGGAANVATNLAGLGVHATLAGFVGRDGAATEIRQALTEAAIETHGLLDIAGPTTVKTRIVSRVQQLMRVDLESTDAPDADMQAQLQAMALTALERSDALVLSDYGKGALSPTLCGTLISAARKRGIPVIVDPKGRDFSKYAGATTVCPNLQELAVVTGLAAKDPEALFVAARRLLERLSLDFLTITMSDKGIHVLAREEDEDIDSPARAREVFDVSGAGDTVVASVAASLAGRLPIDTAIHLANIAAGIVVGKQGTVPVRAGEIVAELARSSGQTALSKVASGERAQTLVREWHDAGEKVVFTNGCFDLLHLGHITLLEACRAFGSKLVVGINADASVSALKGPRRPVNREEDRSRVIASLGSVDLVVLFEEDTPLHLIELLRPDVLVKGGDYQVATVVGSEEILRWGGRVQIVPLVEGLSTTNLLDKISQGGAL